LVFVNGTAVLDVLSGTATVTGVAHKQGDHWAGTLDVSTGDLGSGAALDCAAVHQTASTGKLGVYATSPTATSGRKTPAPRCLCKRATR